MERADQENGHTGGVTAFVEFLQPMQELRHEGGLVYSDWPNYSVCP